MIVWAFETLVASTILMLLVLAIRNPVRRAFGPAIAYALWAIPVARLILPPLPDSWHEGAAAPLAQAGATITYYIAEPLGVPADAALPTDPSIWSWLLVAWVVGAVGFIGYHMIAHGRFCARIRRRASRSDIVAAGNVEVIETDAATGPLAFGVWRKYVAFPRDFADRYDPLERQLALAHELGHHARGDLIANWIALLVLALHWFNPVAWRAFRAFRADQEMACDALVLAGRARELRAAYGRAIVKSAHGGAVSAACHLHTINEIKGRLRMLTRHEKTSKRRMLAGAGATAALLIAGLGVTASGTQAAETVRTSVETAVGVDLASIELPSLAQSEPLPPPPGPPSPPAPPAAPEAPDAPVVKKNVRVIIKDKDGKIVDLGDDGESPAGAIVVRNRVVMVGKDGKVITLPEAKPGTRVERRSYVFRGKDGKTMTFAGGPDTPLPPEFAEKMKEMRVDLRNMPDISSRECKDTEGKAGEHVINRKDGDKRITIICTNRIERMASLAALDADRAGARSFIFQRRAEASALEGLRAARKSVEANRSMTDTQRSAALSGIDEAIREMEAKKD